MKKLAQIKLARLLAFTILFSTTVIQHSHAFNFLGFNSDAVTERRFLGTQHLYNDVCVNVYEETKGFLWWKHMVIVQEWTQC